jgi:tetratricopeptide (TPR) repeat protein/O-antigen ligase
MAAEPLLPRRTPAPTDGPAAYALRAAAEAVLLALVALSPWPFGSVQPIWEFVLLAGLALVVALWVAHVIVCRRLTYRADAVSACLLGLILLTAAQLIPLPESAVRILSPTLAHWHQTLRPAVEEVLPGEDGPGRPRPGSLPLSIDPAATQDALVRLVAVFLAYAVTRNFIASKGSFHRLAWVGLANGLLLAVLALAQSFSSGLSTVYWQVVTVNESFGPFVNKNHFPFYENLCVGLGLGLLALAVRRLPRPAYRDELTEEGWFARAVGSLRELLRSPRVVGLTAGLGLMLASVALSRSRGGLVAVIAAGVVTAAVGRWARGGHTGMLAAGLAAVVVGLVAWFGWSPLEGRVATLWRGTADNRTPIWREVLPIASHFPLTGTGLGTIARAEQTVRTRSNSPGQVMNSLANEYLEAAVEGGVVGALLTIGLAGSVIGFAVRGAGRLRRRSAGAMLLGSVFGLTAVAVHAIGDFGPHIPAVALLIAVVAGQTVAATNDTPPRNGSSGRSRLQSRRDLEGSAGASQKPARTNGSEAEREPSRPVVLSGLSAIAVAAVMLVVGLQPAWAAWRNFQADRLRAAAAVVVDTDDPDRLAKAVLYLEAATRLRPDDAEVWSALAGAHVARDEANPALRAARTARDICPLLPGPHLRLGALAGKVIRGEPAAVHFDRAKRVAGFDPDVWYFSGAAAFARGEFEAAWADWKECLSRSPRRLTAIVRQANGHLSPDQLRARVLPDDPTVWVTALGAMDLDGDARTGWLRTAAVRFAAGPEPDRAAGWLAWASAEEQLGDRPGSIAVLRRAVERFPESIEVRDRLAAVLHAEELDDEAVGHLEWLLTRRPTDPDFRDRLDAARHAVELRRIIDTP